MPKTKASQGQNKFRINLKGIAPGTPIKTSF